MTGLSVQAGGGDVTGPVIAAGGQQDEVTRERLILPHHHHVPHLTESDRHTPDTPQTSIINTEHLDKRVTCTAWTAQTHGPVIKGISALHHFFFQTFFSFSEGLSSCVTDYESGAA